jgi:hypothetical protein
MNVPTVDMLEGMNAEDMLVTITEMDKTHAWTLLVPSKRFEDDDGFAIAFLFDGVNIVDPTRSDCGRFDADPVKDYNLSPVVAMTMMVMNRILAERA